MPPKPCANGPCKYLGFLTLTQWCRHPAHLEPLEPGRALAIEAAGSKCASYVDFEAKIMVTQVQWWLDPVNLIETFSTEDVPK